MDSNFQFLVASPSEGDGTQVSKMRADLSRNRRFESISLQRRVTCELDFLDKISSSLPPGRTWTEKFDFDSKRHKAAVITFRHVQRICQRKRDRRHFRFS